MLAHPVFVLDAQGQHPLMPLVAAAAEHLLQTSKARRWPYPTLSVIQLTDQVAQPDLHPVVVGIAIHRRAVELFVVAAQVHQALPLLYGVVDVPASLPRWRPHPRRRRAEKHAAKLLRHIAAGIGALWRFLPLSHIVVLPTSTLQHAHPDLARRLRQRLRCGDLHVAIATSSSSAPLDIPDNLYALLSTFAQQPTAFAPTVVIRLVDPPNNLAQIRQVMHSAGTEPIPPGIGIVGQPPLMGIFYESPDEFYELQVPIAASVSGVTWEYLIVEGALPMQVWSLPPVALLPLSPGIRQPGIVPLEEIGQDSNDGVNRDVPLKPR